MTHLLLLYFSLSSILASSRQNSYIGAYITQTSHPLKRLLPEDGLISSLLLLLQDPHKRPSVYLLKTLLPCFWTQGS
jgi:hypothetical protein